MVISLFAVFVRIRFEGYKTDSKTQTYFNQQGSGWSLLVVLKVKSRSANS